MNTANMPQWRPMPTEIGRVDRTRRLDELSTGSVHCAVRGQGATGAPPGMHPDTHSPCPLPRWGEEFRDALQEGFLEALTGSRVPPGEPAFGSAATRS